MRARPRRCARRKGDGVTQLLGAIEAGGTKWVLGTGQADGTIAARHVIPTRDPGTTLAEARDWLAGQGTLAAIGIGSFGPVELDRSRGAYGSITSTPKPGWRNTPVVPFFAGAFGVPIGFDTDVNAAALGEHEMGAGAGAAGCAYVTVGTGIGGGIVIGGRTVAGAGHPEVGHAFPRRGKEDFGFAGQCPYHGDCYEGLASGPAIQSRWGATLSDLPPDHEAHDLVAGYLAQLCHTIFATAAVEVIVLGGGVLGTPGLRERVAERTAALNAGYLPGGDRQRIVAPGLGDHSGLTGALLLAARALSRA